MLLFLQTNDAAGLCLVIELLLQVNGYYTLNYCSWVFLNPWMFLSDFLNSQYAMKYMSIIMYD